MREISLLDDVRRGVNLIIDYRPSLFIFKKIFNLRKWYAGEGI